MNEKNTMLLDLARKLNEGSKKSLEQSLIMLDTNKYTALKFRPDSMKNIYGLKGVIQEIRFYNSDK